MQKGRTGFPVRPFLSAQAATAGYGVQKRDDARFFAPQQ